MIINKLYEKKADRIIFYPLRYEYNALGVILSLSTLFILLPLIFSLKENGIIIEPIYVIAIFLLPLLVFLSFLLMGNICQIIICTSENKIYKKNLFGKRVLASLCDIENICFTQSPTPYIKSYIYELTYKKNKYLDGICLTPKLRLKSKSLKMMRETILQEVEELLQHIQPVSNENISNNSIKFFTEQRRGYYIYVPTINKLIFIIGGILCLSLFIYLIMSNANNNYYYFIPLLISILSFVFSTDKTIIDLNNKVLQMGFVGRISKVSLHDISNIFIRYRNGMPVNNGDTGSIDIVIVYYDHKKKRCCEYIIYTASKRNKKFAQFAGELEILLGHRIEI